jgi:hypothetical protein
MGETARRSGRMAAADAAVMPMGRSEWIGVLYKREAETVRRIVRRRSALRRRSSMMPATPPG